MKCPKCGLENPASATVCECGFSLVTREADLEKSLAKQAQAIREEVKKIQTVDSDVKAEVGDESPRFLSLSIRLYTMFRHPWPYIVGLPMPVKLLGGVFLAGLVAIVLLFGLLVEPDVVLEGDQLSPDQRSTIESLGILEPNERILYFYSDGLWDIKERFCMLTDQALIVNDHVKMTHLDHGKLTHLGELVILLKCALDSLLSVFQ